MAQDIEEYTIDNYIFKRTIGWTEVKKSIIKIANQINIDYKNKEPIFLITLKGAIFFAVELLKEIELDCSIEIISSKSYGSKMQSETADVLIKYENYDLLDKDVIIIEDVIDTGYSMEKLLQTINEFHPKSVAIASLINKPEKLITNVNIDYLGFSVSPEFIIGSGMDYNEKGRQLKGIYTLVSK